MTYERFQRKWVRRLQVTDEIRQQADLNKKVHYPLHEYAVALYSAYKKSTGKKMSHNYLTMLLADSYIEFIFPFRSLVGNLIVDEYLYQKLVEQTEFFARMKRSAIAHKKAKRFYSYVASDMEEYAKYDKNFLLMKYVRTLKKYGSALEQYGKEVYQDYEDLRRDIKKVEL